MARTAALSLCLAAGLAYAAMVLGLAPLDPSNADWMKGDPVEHYLAWMIAQKSDFWHFPLSWTERLGYPFGTYLSLVDPAFVILFGPIAPYLPYGWQPFGLFFALNAGLQLYCGYKLCRLLAQDDDFTGKIGGLLMMLSPIMMQKGQGHFSGGCQWPIIAGLYCLLRPVTNPWRWMAPLWGLVALSSVIHPYTGATLVIIAEVAAVRLYLERNNRHSRIRGSDEVQLLAHLAIPPILLAAVFYAIGILGVGGGSAAGGFKDYSFNLLALFNPAPYRALAPWSLPYFPLQEFEGYAYLGLGVLGLLLISLRKWRLPQPAVLLMAVCLVIALSTRVTLGRMVLFEYDLPGPLQFAANAFRAPARFIWPAYYLLIGLAVAAASGLPRSRILLLAALLVQFLDVAGLREHVRHFQASRSPDPALYNDWDLDWPGPSPIWSQLGRDHAHLAALPAWQCGQRETPGGSWGYAMFGRVATSQQMTINEYRASRYDAASLAFHCDILPDQVRAGQMQRDTAYVLSDLLLLQAIAGGATAQHHCEKTDGYNLCVAGEGTRDWRGIIAPAATGTALATGQRGEGLRLLAAGWNDPEADGTWTSVPEAKLVLPLPSPLPVEIAFSFQALLAADQPSQRVAIKRDGKELARWTIDIGNWQEAKIVHILDPPSSGVLILDVAVDAVSTPASHGYAGDDRIVGVKLRSVTVRQ